MRALILALLVPISSYGAGKIVNADIAASGTANIARNKLAAGTAYAWCVNDVSGFQADAAVTASRAVATDANGAPVASATTATELGYVNGVTSAIQTQLNGKQASGNYITALTGDGTAAGPGSSALTLATVNTNVGTFTNATFTVNAKGLVTAASSGTAPVTAVSVASANGFAGSSSGGATPALTLSTTITGLLKGNGTAISAASSGTDYQAPISTNAGASHQFFTAFTSPNTFTLAQPAFTDISGTATVAQTTIANQAQSTCNTAATIDWSTGNSFTMLLTNAATCAVTFSNAVSGQTITIDYTQPASTGSAVVSYVTTVKWAGGTAPTMTTGVSKSDSCTFKYNGTDYRGSCLQDMR